MKLFEIFKQPVDRPLKGVIIADDNDTLEQEVKEYVLTKEVEGRLSKFLDAYNNYEGANGAWISGFFGSGKSHLLKMVALLLENRVFAQTSVVETFLEKADDNEILKADIKRAVSTPSQSILFNIDQKADVISKTEVDALLSVFVKVFDEACGYFGKQAYIAQFERELDKDNLLDEFKQKFASLEPQGWEWGRQRTLRVSSFIDEAYSSVTGQKIQDILEKYRADFKLSIEDFADNVASYIAFKPKGFRLNFFVDEVGQYIAENTKLMTNLQTVAESLATKCKGQAWIIVTAQEDMNSVIGEMDKRQSNDFSKIQARFANRMKLTSADVAEVIQKRLLLKTDEGVEVLSSIYHKESNNFKTLFDFSDGAVYKNFQDREHFIHSYPFIPYQFVLFQSAIQTLSKHNAFEGEHSSVGERSMLGVFREVAIKINNHDIGKLATFDLMFEGISTALKSQIQRAISVADKNIDNKFAVKLLKVLFLIKYIKEFKATIRNLTVLMLEDFNQDQLVLRKKIEEALNLLEQQTYIQRNGEVYEFLTDEEQDVESEIKNTEVETSDVLDEIQKIVFDYVIKNRRIKFNENNQDYAFARKIDDKIFGRDYDLSIHIITPLNENSGNDSILRMQNMGKDELLIVLPNEDRVVRDILMYKKTDKYIRQNISVTQQETIKRILTDKSYQNKERYDELRHALEESLAKAKLFVGEKEQVSSSEDAVSRINNAFQSLILRAFPNLMMLKNIAYTEKDVVPSFKKAKDGLFASDDNLLSEPELEMLSFINTNKRNAIRTTIKSVIEKFEIKPYGWYFAAILCNLAYLAGKGKIELKIDSNSLEDKDIEKSFLNTAQHPNIVIEPQIDYTLSQVRALKEIYEDFFDEPASHSEAKDLAAETSKKFKEKHRELETILAQRSSFPFVISVQSALDFLKDLADKPAGWYLTDLEKIEDELFKIKKEIISPIVGFFNNDALKNIYLDASKFLKEQQPNFNYVQTDEVTALTDILVDSECYRDNKLSNAKILQQSIQEKIDSAIAMELENATVTINRLKNKLEILDDFEKLTAEIQKSFLQKFDDTITALKRNTLIAVIKDSMRKFEDEVYPQIAREISELTSRREETPTSSNEAQNTQAAKVEYVSSKSLKIDYNKPWLSDEDDVENYIELMKKALLKEIKDGKRVQV